MENVKIVVNCQRQAPRDEEILGSLGENCRGLVAVSTNAVAGAPERL